MLLWLKLETEQFIVLYFKYLKSTCLPCEYTINYSEYRTKTYQKLNYTKFSTPSCNFTTIPLSLRYFFWCIFFMLLVLSIKYESQFHDRHKNHKILCLPWKYYMIYFCVKYILNLSIGMIFSLLDIKNFKRRTISTQLLLCSVSFFILKQIFQKLFIDWG